MNLPALLRRKRMVLLGLNSGTSADSLDLAAVRIDRTRAGYRIGVLDGSSRKYPPQLREAILALADDPEARLDDTVRLDQGLGRFYGKAARDYMNRCSSKGIRIDAVASHGQTVRHLPEPVRFAGTTVHGTLQLGNPEQIAAATATVVVADFRQADVAVGNEGAPITTPAMVRMMGDTKESRLVVNIGGMSNFFYLPATRLKRPTLAEDCGPGNVLSDLSSRRLFGEPYDRGGRRALGGQISRRLLALIQADPFFDSHTVSTGRETFGPQLLERAVKQGKRLELSLEDIHASVAEVTPLAIARRVNWLRERDRTLDKLYLTGGGSRNRFFVQRLKALLAGMTVATVAELGFDPDLVEAVAFAVLGEAALRSEGVSTLGRGAKPVVGRIIQPPA